MPLTPDIIASILKCPQRNVVAHWPLIEAALEGLGIGSPLTKVAAIATIGVECPPFRPIKEYGSDDAHNKAYFGRLGNIQEGDGARYAGKGFIQLTGRDNYRAYGKLLGINLVGNPDMALEPNTAAAIFAAYFKEKKVNEAADQNNWLQVRRKVNGGINGLPKFLTYVNALKEQI